MAMRVNGSLASGLAGKAVAGITIKVAAAGLSFAMFVALARALPTDAFGQFGFAFSLATILAVVGSMGQRNLVLRFTSIYLSDGDSAQARGVIGHSGRIVLMGSALLAAGLIALSFVTPSGPVLRATAGLTIALALGEFLPHPQRAAGKVWLALLPRDVLLRLGMIGIAGLAMLGVFPDADAAATIWAMAGLMLTLSIVQAFLLPETRPDLLITGPRDLKGRTEWLHAMWGFWGNSVLNSAGRNMAMVILAMLLPAALLGAFFAALRTSMVLELALMGINIVAAPMLAGCLHRKDLDRAQDVCRRIALMLGVPTIGVFLVIVLAGDRVLGLFGAGYAEAHIELVILATGYLVSACAGPTMQIMEMGGFERQYFRILAITTGASLATLAPMTLLFGSAGAALCIAGNLIALNVWSYIFIHRHLGLSAGLIPLGGRR